MTYQEREQRRVIENDGNIGLFVDERERFYTEIDGKKVFFRWPAPYKDIPIHRGDWDGDPTLKWWGDFSWNPYAAERVGNTIKLIDRTWGYPHKMWALFNFDKTIYPSVFANRFLYASSVVIQVIKIILLTKLLVHIKS